MILANRAYTFKMSKKARKHQFILQSKNRLYILLKIKNSYLKRNKNSSFSFFKVFLCLFKLTHGLWLPNEAFFCRNPKLLGWGRQFRQINFGSFGVFSAPSAPILVQWVPCPCFPLINHYFYKKPSLYIQIFIWDWYLNLNLTIVCP